MRCYPTTVLLLVASLSGCRRTDSVELSTKNEVVVGVGGDMLTLNPFLANDINSQNIHLEVFQSLNTLHPKTHRLMPVLASLPEITPDKLTYTYILDPRARWSDGIPVAVGDVIFTFKSVLNPAARADEARSTFVDLDSVWSPAAGKVSFHFRSVNFGRDFDIGKTWILPTHCLDSGGLTQRITWVELRAAQLDPLVQSAGENFASTETSGNLKNFVGSGPYVFEEWRRGEQVVLRRSSNYWASQIPWLEAYPERLVYRAIPDNNSRMVALKAREIDLTTLPSDKPLEDFDTKMFPFIRKDTLFAANYSCICWNGDRPIFRSKRVRRALAMLVDRDAINHALHHSLYKKIEGPVTPVQPDFDPTVRQPAFDPVAANQLLAEDGWKDTDGDGILDKVLNGKRVPFKFNFVSTGKSPTLLMLIEQMRKSGIEASLSILEFSVINQNLRHRSYDACLRSLVLDPVEGDLFDYYHSSSAHTGGWNITCYANPEVDRLIEQIQVELDAPRRITLSKRLQHILAEDQPQTFLFTGPAKYAWIDRFENVILEPIAPYLDPRYLIVRGSGVHPIPHSGS